MCLKRAHECDLTWASVFPFEGRGVEQPTIRWRIEGKENSNFLGG